MNKIKVALSLALITVILLPSLTAATQLVLAQETSIPDHYTVSWEKKAPQYTDSWTWNRRDWLFGPIANVSAAYIDGRPLFHPITREPVNVLVESQQFYVNVTVPKTLFDYGRNVSEIQFTISKDKWIRVSGSDVHLWNIFITMICIAYPEEGSGQTKGFLFRSHFFNYTAGTEETGLVFTPNNGACIFAERLDSYSARFQGQFVAIPSWANGTFDTSFVIYDTKGAPVNAGSQWGARIALLNPDQPRGQEWVRLSASMKDMNNQDISVISPEMMFKIVVALSAAANVRNVTVVLTCPVDSGWWSDFTRNTLHLTWFKAEPHYSWYYNDTQSMWILGWHDVWKYRRALLTADLITHTFRIAEAYEYRVYTAADWGSMIILYDIAVPGLSFFYNLFPESQTYPIGDSLRIEYVAMIPQSANASSGDYQYDVFPYGLDDKMLPAGSGTQLFSILGLNVVWPMLLKNNSEDPVPVITPGPSSYFRPVMIVRGTDALKHAIRGHTSNITFVFLLAIESTWWSQGFVDYQRETYLELHLTRNTMVNNTFAEMLNHTTVRAVNRITHEANEVVTVQQVSAASYVTLAPQSFIMTENPVTGILTLAFNLTFLPTVPTGTCRWEPSLRNRTIGNLYDWYKYSPDGSIRYTEVAPGAGASAYFIHIGGVRPYENWGVPQKWFVNPTTGAIDLDGDEATIDDQYYVLQLFTSTNEWITSGEEMFVNLTWGTYNMISYFCLKNRTLRCEWNEIYIWLNASDMNTVSAATFSDRINSTIWFPGSNVVRPEYSQLSFMTLNKTWDRIKAEYAEYDWWRDTYTWNWLDIRFRESFSIPHVSVDSFGRLLFQYAGLLLFNDTNSDGVLNIRFEDGLPKADELSHYFVFEDSQAILLVTPQPGDTGRAEFNVYDDVSWGVSVLGIDGTIYPTKIRDYTFAGLDWWWLDCYGKFAPEGNFSAVPSRAGIENLNFTAHFSIPNANLTSGATNEVLLKVDSEIGSWTLRDRPLSSLIDYSLAVAFLATSENWQYTFTLSNGTNVGSEGNSTASDGYIISMNQEKLADIQMGGAVYTWGRDGQNYTMHSSTTPMSAFSRMYSTYKMTGSGETAISTFSATGTKYFMTSCFEHWDGYGIDNDPYFAVFQGSSPGGGGLAGGSLIIIVVCTAAVVTVVALTAVILKKRQKPT